MSSTLPREGRKHEWVIYNTPIKDGSGRVRGLYSLGIDNTGESGARRRLALVSEASGVIGSTLDIQRTAEELAQVLVPAVADFVTVDLLDSLFAGQEPRPGAADGSAELRRMAAQSVVAGCPESVLKPGETDIYAEYSHVAQTLATGKSRIVGLQGDESYANRWAGTVGDRSGSPRPSASTPRSWFPSGPGVPPSASPLFIGIRPRTTSPATICSWWRR